MKPLLPSERYLGRLRCAERYFRSVGEIRFAVNERPENGSDVLMLVHRRPAIEGCPNLVPSMSVRFERGDGHRWRAEKSCCGSEVHPTFVVAQSLAFCAKRIWIQCSEWPNLHAAEIGSTARCADPRSRGLVDLGSDDRRNGRCRFADCHVAGCGAGLTAIMGGAVGFPWWRD